MRRRTFLAAAALSAVSPSMASAREDDAFPEFPNRLRGFENLPELTPPDLQALGSGEPDDIDKRVAARIIELAPYNCAPIQVAEFFRGIGQGQPLELGDPEMNARFGPHFVRGWPQQYNPLIIEFFNATSTQPLAPGAGGDSTPWCAAFVNWCIVRAQSTGGGPRVFGADELANATRSASSGSFRCWQDEVSEPQYGDIIVWGTEPIARGCAHGAGHVAFYTESADADHWMTLGGNQRSENRSDQNAITCRRFGRRFRAGSNGDGLPLYKAFHSFRTAPFLRPRT